MIDILMACYNNESHIREQLDSILNQTETGWTLYIRDDDSKLRQRQRKLFSPDGPIQVALFHARRWGRCLASRQNPNEHDRHEIPGSKKATGQTLVDPYRSRRRGPQLEGHFTFLHEIFPVKSEKKSAEPPPCTEHRVRQYLLGQSAPAKHRFTGS